VWRIEWRGFEQNWDLKPGLGIDNHARQKSQPPKKQRTDETG